MNRRAILTALASGALSALGSCGPSAPAFAALPSTSERLEATAFTIYLSKAGSDDEGTAGLDSSRPIRTFNKACHVADYMIRVLGVDPDRVVIYWMPPEAGRYTARMCAMINQRK